MAYWTKGYEMAMSQGDVYINKWATLCRRYLPYISDDAKWRLSRAVLPDDPEQGWKLHLSATLLNAGEMLEKVAPILQAGGVLFKAPASLYELSLLNSGLDYGYGQVGKVITIYPRNNEEAVRLAHELHGLTSGMAAPAVPFDRQFRAGSCLYYRYGAFKELDLQSSTGAAIPALRSPDGSLIPDSRESWASELTWISDPFAMSEEFPALPEQASPGSPLRTTFRVFRALSQRGRGGVYQAIDLRTQPPRLCILKEGRRNGETGLDGLDGSHRIRHEANVLSCLRNCGIEVPDVYAFFEVEGNSYLAMEYIAGESLHSMIKKRQRRLTIPQVLRRVIQITDIVGRLHAVGWAWRDCKPGNLLVTRGDQFRPIDFESACPSNQSDPVAFGTPGFTPPETNEMVSGSAPDDLFALGAILYLLLTGRIPATTDPAPATKWRRNLPSEILSVISELMAPEPRLRPCATIVSERLKVLLSTYQN